GEISRFFYTGITSEEREQIGDLPQGRGLLGIVIRENQSLRLEDLTEHAASAGFPPHHPPMKRLLAVPIAHEGQVFGRIYLCDKLDGAEFTSEDQLLVQNFAQTISMIHVHALEVMRRKQAQEDLRRSEGRLRKVLQSAHDAFIATDGDGVITDWNLQAEKTFGWSCSEALGRELSSVIIPPQYREAHQRGLRRFLATGQDQAMNKPRELAALHREGHEFPVELVIWPVRLGDGYSFNAFVRDISERRRVEAERDLMTAQLRQSQKLEAVGRLAGGVAHDFNNLLTVIIGCNDLMLETLEQNHPLHTDAEEIQTAAQRAASLTRQLLAFSRRQVFKPRVLDLNDVASGMQAMLERLIGEHVQLESIPDPELGYVKADPGQFEQVLMNVVLNARDAMPQGGKITIETANVHLDKTRTDGYTDIRPGHYVVLAVSDTGCGIDAETRAHLFDPFFTTKEVGQGTGLGLATVYGIIKQSGGEILVSSEPGRGTTFTIYLPRVEMAAVAAHPVEASGVPASGSETVLLVEDEDGVRALARRSLQQNGYNVLEAGQGSEALSIDEQHDGPIHLLVTDVVMPQISGPELAECLASSRPDMKVLYMSGYPDDAVIHHGLLDDGTENFLPKPFTPRILASKVREVLGDIPVRR
ncbi:MAG: PAS domain S-box protein, partial [Acidobacteriota bacterium]